MFNIYLIGYRAAGKTSVARALSEKLGRKTVHLDDEIKKRVGKIDDFVDKNGWDAFRDIETELLEQISDQNNLVVDCGGGIVTRERNIEIIRKTGIAILLTVSVEKTKERLIADHECQNRRPSLTGKPLLEEVEEVLAERMHLYRNTADHEIDTGNCPVEEVAVRIIDLIRTPRIAITVGCETTQKTIQELERAQEKSELVEVRIDFVEDIDKNNLKKLLGCIKGPVIVTNRSKSEGGRFQGSEEERITLLKEAVRLGADFIDIELGSGRVGELLDEREKTAIICSYHNFEEVPGNIGEIYHKLAAIKADIIKIACMGNSFSDNRIVFDLIERAREEKREIIASVMGKYGRISRILSVPSGAFLTYASLGEEFAPGQVHVDELFFIKKTDRITQETGLFVLIGDPVGHSVSSAMHNAAFGKAGLDCFYFPMKVGQNDLGDTIEMVRELDIKGLNVTLPHKSSVIPFLDEVDRVAERIGAVNTIVNDGGRLKGYNTDSTGFITSIEKFTQIRDKSFVLAGAGGAARAIAFGILDQGGGLTVLDRRPERAKELAESLGCGYGGLENLDFVEADVLVNATSVGMEPGVGKSIATGEQLRNFGLVYDAVYNPRETELLERAKEAGCRTAGGLGMLVNQGATSFELWTGIKPDIGFMYEVAGNNLERIC
jgi:3-dehydroquinate dehydratase/shikimate dehydrogenase